MNRRNFILGLGTAATLSGAASVTGASISGTAEAGTSFQVIAENNLAVQRNSSITEADNNEIDNSTYDNYVNTSVGYINDTGTPSGEGTINGTIGSGIEDVNGPRLTVNNEQDGNLEMALATQNDATLEDNQNGSLGNVNSSYSDEFGTSNDGTTAGSGNAAPPLELVNNGGQSREISVRYDYGSTVTDGGNNLGEDDVAQLFTFRVNADNGEAKVSPDPSEAPLADDGTGNANNSVTLQSGEEATVDFVLNYSDSLVNEIEDAASGGSNYNFNQDGFASVELLTSVTFGVVE
jgi:hypothetical protein